MNELTIDQLQAVFGSRLKEIDNSISSMERSVDKIVNIVSGAISDKVSFLGKELGKIELSIQELAKTISNKPVDEQGNVKVNDVLDSLSNNITTGQEKTADKITSNFSYNFRSLNDQLKLINDLSVESNRELLTALKNTVDEKIDKLTAVVQGSYKTNTPQPVAERQQNTATELLLTQQLLVLEKLKDSVDTKLSATLESVSSTEKLMAKKAKAERLNPPEFSLSKKDRKMLQAIDTSDEILGLTKEIKSSKKIDPSSGIGKFLSPFFMVLGAVGAIAFAAFKFPSIKKLWKSFTQTKIGGGIMDIFKNATPKGMDIKTFVKQIPFIGRLADLWDALDLLHQGKTKEGLKQLAFAVPGMEFLAILSGSSKERFLKPYDKSGDKSLKIFGYSIEQLWSGLINVTDTVFKPVMDFFTSAFGALGEGFNLLKKGTGMNYQDIATTWDKITTDYFPSLKPVAKIIKWAAKSAFDWTSGRMGGAQYKLNDEGEMVPLDVGDLVSNVWERIQELFTTISSKIQDAFEYVKELLSALGMVFSSNRGTQLKGLGLLERQGMGGLADGISMFLNVMASIEDIAGPDGNIGFMDMIKGAWKGIDVTKGPFSREKRRTAGFAPGDQDAYKSVTADKKKMDQLVQGYTDLQKQQPIEEWDWMSRLLTFKNARVGLPETKEEKEKWLKEILDQILELDPSMRSKAAELAKKSGIGIAIPAYEEQIPQLKEQQEKQKAIQQSETTADAATEATTALYQMGETSRELTAMWQNIVAQRESQFNPQTDAYTTIADKNYDALMKQAQAIQEQNGILREQVQLLKQTAFESKKGNEYLERTSRGVGILADRPQNGPIFVNNTNRNNMMGDTSTGALAYKQQALGKDWLTTF